MAGFREGDEVWVRVDSEWVWELGSVIEALHGDEVVVSTRSGKKFLTDDAHPSNLKVDGGFDDMTSMTYISEPTILSNLHRRSYADRPYTFMGPVLVAVNPLRPVAEAGIRVGHSSVSTKAHPYAVAETAYQQLSFGTAQAKRTGAASEGPISQTVVVGGESGAGKTESSKMVLHHLVARCGGGELDKRLLGNNAILESFGNAQTLRNPNSSRFGKLLKLHFDGDAKQIVGASIATYLLERSRVTSHEGGERGYHIFYQILAGLSKEKGYGVSPKVSYAYLCPAGQPNVKPLVRPEDTKHFDTLCQSFRDLGLQRKDINLIFKAVAGVLHLGNITFEDDDRPEGFVAEVKGDQTSQTALTNAVITLGFPDKEALVRLFAERKIKTPGSKTPITAFNDSKQAAEARDAVARTLYTRIFNYVLRCINSSIDADGATAGAPNTIGVLDIFGFESFQHNDFEQLLINYTNESLQATFNEQIFHAEAELYRREGLTIEKGDKISKPKGNSECMLLLEGAGKKTPGVLDLITQEAEMRNATDSKLNDRLHKTFGLKNKCFGKVHPKDIARNFIIVHYAAKVTYTIGSFLHKNADSMPKEVDEIMALSNHPLMAEIWSCANAGDGKAKSSIVAKFKTQIMDLKDYLNSTRCSFIRCIKPNPLMVRDDDSWFDRRYVTLQLKALSVLQTAEVLKNGFPTRLSYEWLTQTYQSILPADAISAWKGLGGGSHTAFIAGLFWAFGIPRSAYKLGVTKVFFKSGMLAELDGILNAASDWSGNDNESKDEVVGRFRKFFARRRWRVGFAKAVAYNCFASIMTATQNRAYAAIKVQRWYRAQRMLRKLRRRGQSAVLIQKVARGRMARRNFRQLLAERAKEIQLREMEARRAFEQAQKEKAEAERRREEARLERERKERELEEARLASEAAQRKRDEIAKREKQFASFKSMEERLMEKRRRQLAHLEEMDNSITTAYDSPQEEEYAKLIEEREAESQRIAEFETQADQLEREVEAAREAELEWEQREKDLVEHFEITKDAFTEAMNEWKIYRARLDRKRALQREELEDANKLLGEDRGFSRRVLNSKARMNATHLVKMRNAAINPLKNGRLRASRKARTLKNNRGDNDDEERDGSEDDSDYDSDESDRMANVEERAKHIWEADGEKLPIKPGNFRLFNRWRKRRFVLDTSKMRIRYFAPDTKNKRHTPKDNGYFCLNTFESANPTHIIIDPPRYSSKQYVLEFSGGYMYEDFASVDPAKRRRTLIMSFSLKRDRDDWIKQLSRFVKNLDQAGVDLKRNSFQARMRRSLRLSNRSTESETKYDSPDEEKAAIDEINAMTTRFKLLERSEKFSSEERERLLINAKLKNKNKNSDEEDDEDDLSDNQSFAAFCKNCNLTHYVTSKDEICPNCGESFSDD